MNRPGESGDSSPWEGRSHVRFYVEARRGAQVSWGAYPNPTYTGTNYYVKVYAGGVRVDTKNQAYAPHGSLSAARSLKYSGKIFELNGTVTRNGKLVLKFDLICRIA